MNKDGILLVGNNEFIIRLLQSLHYAGEQISMCCSLREALQQPPGKFSVVLTALSLPDAINEHVFEALQAKFSSLPIIVVSNLAEEELAIKTMAAGAQDYLIQEELDTQQLQKAISKAIERKRNMRQQLLHDDQQIRAIINNTHDMIWSVDKDKNLIIANDAFRQRMQQLNGNASATAMLQAITTKWQSYFDNAFGGNALMFTWQERIGDKVFYDEVSLYPIRNEDDDVTGVSCFSRDITRQQLRLQKIQLQNEYLEKVAWMHSHEVRGPVANIMGLTSLLDINQPDDPDNQMMLELIVESAHLLDKAIRRIAVHIDDYQLGYEDEEA